METQYKVSEYSIIHPTTLQEIVCAGFSIYAADDKDAIKRFNKWKEYLTESYQKVGIVFGREQPVLYKLEPIIIAH